MVPQVGGWFARAWPKPLRKLGVFSDFLRWPSGQPVFLHGFDPGSSPGEAQIEEIVKFLAKPGRPRGSSARPPGPSPGALPTALRWVIYMQVGGWFYPISTFPDTCATFKT